MVQQDLLRPETRGLVKIILRILRGFDLIHKKMKNRGEADFGKRKIYYKKDQEYYEGMDTLLHEFVHVYRDCYLGNEKPPGDEDEAETVLNADYWGKLVFGDLENI